MNFTKPEREDGCLDYSSPGNCDEGTKGEGEDAGNIALIACAPKMYETLREIVDGIRTRGVPLVMSDVVAIAREAVHAVEVREADILKSAQEAAAEDVDDER